MKGSKQTSFIIVAGVIVLGIFAFVIAYNLLPRNRQSNAYYVKVGETMSAKIDSLNIDGNILTINTLGDAEEFCVKSTRTTPDKNSICWKKIQSNMAEIKIYKYKQYYIWIKDASGNISSPMSIDASKN